MSGVLKNNVRWLLDYVIILLFALVVVFFSLISDSFFSLQNVSNILIQASSLAIIATGMTFVLLVAGIDLSVGAIMFLAGVILGKMVVAGLPLWLACIVVLAVGLLFGLINAFFIFRLRLIPFIVTLATFYVGRGLGLMISETRAINLPESILQVGSARLFGLPFPIMMMFLVMTGGHIVLTSTTFGRQLYAIGHGQEKSRKAGINVSRSLLLVYVICGLCAAVGGLVSIAQLGAVSPTFGLEREFMAIAAAVLGGTSLFGGRGSIIPGTLIGVLLIQTIESGLVIVNADPYIYPVITGAVMFLIVMLDSLRNKVLMKEKSE